MSLHIRGAILALEHQSNSQRSLAGASLAFSPKDGSPGVDTRGIIPWHPNGAPFELTIPRVTLYTEPRLRLFSLHYIFTTYHPFPFHFLSISFHFASLWRMQQSVVDANHRE